MAALLLGTGANAQSNTIPIFQFAIFYNHLLEFTWCPPMTINGRVHANADVYTGSAWHLNFNDSVSLTGAISSPPWSGYVVTDYTVPAFYASTPVTNSSPLTLFNATANTSDAMREIINMPPAGGDINPALASQRFYNKAGVVLLVSNSTISAIIRSPSDGTITNIVAKYYPTNSVYTNYVNVVTNFPFLNVTNFFATNPNPVYDDRENDTLKLTDINMAILNQWLFTNSAVNSKFPRSGSVYPSPTNAPNIMYVADNRSYNNGYLTAVRLKNATTIPTNLFSFMGSNYPSGFTLATPNPLYIYGNYNCPNAAHYSTTNTSEAYPASFISDALTILSGNWDDAKSAGIYAGRNKVTSSTDVTLNAAIITGSVYSTGSDNTQFSGGVHNLPRLLENWSGSGVVLTLNTSIVNLFNSIRATNQFVMPGTYYNAPSSRQYSFDSNFLFPWKLPPGTPMVGPVAPAITSSPQAVVAIAGQSVVFSGSYSGLQPFGYQWFHDLTNALVGATNASLTLSNVQPADAGGYSVLVTNPYGSATSDVATLTVLIPPAINAPLTNLHFLVGQTASFNVLASGTVPLAFQWQFNGTNLDGATDAALSLTNISLDQAGPYVITVTNIAGAATNSVTLSVYETAAASLTSLPTSTGAQFQFSITGVPGFNYVVEVSTNFVDWAPVITNVSPFTLTDDQVTNFPARFYRSIYTP